MNDIKPSHHIHEERIQKSHRPYWKRAHHDWKFWVALFLMFVGMIIYVLSQDLSFRPRNQPHQSHSGSIGKVRNTIGLSDQEITKHNWEGHKNDKEYPAIHESSCMANPQSPLLKG